MKVCVNYSDAKVYIVLYCLLKNIFKLVFLLLHLEPIPIPFID